MKSEKNTLNSEQEHFTEEESFIQGEAYPNCDGEPCVNVAEATEENNDAADKVADAAAEWRDKYIRLQAEFDNYRKRTLKEKMEMVAAAGEDVIKTLLPVVDDLDRALDATKESIDVTAVREGVILISNKFKELLRAKGLSEIDALGKQLDTDLHEAIAQVPASCKKDSGRIVDVIQKGYKLNDKVIRHSKVVVGQ